MRELLDEKESHAIPELETAKDMHCNTGSVPLS